MRSVVSILLAFASVALAETNYIEGQVFVVTAAHESVKLGLVVVAACRADEFADAVSATKSKIDSERAKLDTMRPVADAMAATAAQLHDAVTRAPEPTLSTLLGESIRLEVDTAMLVQRVRWRSDYLDCAAPYFKNLPHPIASAKTDADGKFKMELLPEVGQKPAPVVAHPDGIWAAGRSLVSPASALQEAKLILDAPSSAPALATHAAEGSVAIPERPNTKSFFS